MNYLAITILLGLLILIHELGHFLAARWTGIPVQRFSLGFGPRLWGFRRGGTEFWFSMVPLGGYVLPAVNDEREYLRIPLMRRIVFCLGGPLANLLLAVPLFCLLNALEGSASAYDLLVMPFHQTVRVLGHVLIAIPMLFSQAGNLSGVVGIVVEGGRFVAGDLARAIQFAVVLSINLAVLNLLPIPALDGGKIVLHLLEKLHPKAGRLYVPLSVAGLVFMLGLILYATVLDITRYVS